MMLLGSLSGGGAERVAVNLMNRCDPLAVDLRLGLLRRVGPYLGDVDPCRIVAPKVARTGASGVLCAPADIARMVRAVRPQVLMSFGMGINMLTWLALGRLGRDRPAWICREDSNADAEIAELTASRFGRGLVGAAMGHVYRDADRLQSVSRDQAANLERRLALPPGRVRVIYNPVDVAQIERSAAQLLAVAPERPFIVTAGRLTFQKNHNLLIEAFAMSAAARGMDLVILGEGPLEGDLRARAAALGVSDRVRFAGFQANPWAWFSRARLFVHSSRWEGLPNVIAEALACGVPTLLPDCDFGPREQIVHGQSGWLVPPHDAGALAGGLDTLLGDPDLAARLAAGGKARASDFDADVIAGAYTEFFLEMTGASAGRAAPGRRARPERWRSNVEAVPVPPAA